MTTEWLLVLLVALLIAANALFVAAEFALVTVDRPRVARDAGAGDRRAGSVQKALRTLSTQLSGAQLGITVTSLIVGVIAEPSIATLLAVPLERLGLPDGTATGIALGSAFLIATVTQMVFGELVPKNWAISEPLRVARAVAGPQRAFTTATRPLIAFLNGASNAMVRSLGIEPREELASARSAQELGALASRSATEGLLDSALATRIAHAVTFTERTAQDVMTPRTRVRFIDADASAADVLTLAARTGHARFPVEGESVDDIVGVVHFKSALAVPSADRSTRSVLDVMRPVRAVPSSMPLDAVLHELRSGMQLAVVVDEYGGTDGVVTLEDLIEEIVGEIDDEQDRPSGRPRQLSEGSWSLSGLMRPDEVAGVTGIGLVPSEEAGTVGGVITERLERFASVGDVIELSARDLTHVDEDGLPPVVDVRLTVTHTDGRRVARVRLDRVGATSQEEKER